MSRTRRLLPVFLLLSALTFALPAHGQEDKDKDEGNAYCDLRIEVVAGAKSEAVDNASVYVRFAREGKSERSKLRELNLKTNQQGVARIDRIPQGKVLIQVIAKGWKTFGKWYTLEKEEETVRIKLEEPPRWY